MNQEKRLEILKALQADNPTPKTELEYHSNFELLIAVVLSAQATDKSVNEATRVLFPLGQYASGRFGFRPGKIHGHHQAHRTLPKQNEERDEAL